MAETVTEEEYNKRNLIQHHRSSPGPDTRKPWEKGGMTKTEWNKLPQKYKDMLDY